MPTSTADREAKLAALHERLTDQVRELRTGEDWTRWLTVASRFHDYSFNNTLLILAQRPDATTVAGYRAWQTLGRQVDKGEKGLQILAPVLRRVEVTDADTGEQAHTARVAGYRVTHVWDLSQTSGRPLPERPVPRLLQGQAPSGLWGAMAAAIHEDGFTLQRGETGNANGLTHFGQRTITVRPDVDDAQAVKTLAHELGHVLLHEPGSAVPVVACRGVVEVEAESVAYLVAASHGLDTGSYTFPYVAGWAGSVAGRVPEEIVAEAGHAPLEAPDLDRLAMAAYLTGRDEAAVEGLERAHRTFLDQGEVGRAVRCAFWVGMFLVQRGRYAEGGGWLGRADRLLNEQALDSVERGYLLIPAALQTLGSGDPGRAHEVFGEAAGIADRFGDPDLVALSRLGRGQALVAMGEVRRGVAMLDEAMVTVTTGDVSPVAAGLIYCALVITCRDIFDWGRAQEWTVALSRWCADQQDLKPYRGQCLIHRSEIMQLRGEWSDALAEVQQAGGHLAEPPGDPVLGMAHYQRGELLRLRGEFSRAEQAYRKRGPHRGQLGQHRMRRPRPPPQRRLRRRLRHPRRPELRGCLCGGHDPTLEDSTDNSAAPEALVHNNFPC